MPSDMSGNLCLHVKLDGHFAGICGCCGGARGQEGTHEGMGVWDRGSW